MSDYILRIRDPRTLKLVAILPEYDSVTWTRRDLEAGSFQLDIFLDQLDDVTNVARNNIFEVVRDGTFEFAGVIRRSLYNALDRKLVLSGPDIKGFWLSNREIDPGASEFDVQSGVVGETAMIHYVNDHLMAPSDSTRKMSSELTSPITATARATNAKGSSVDFNARWENLLKLLVEIGERADLTHDIVISPDFTTNPDVDQRHVLRASTAKVTNWDNGADQSIGYTTDIPDLKTVIQEIVDRSGWAIGNALCLLLDMAQGGGNQYEFTAGGHASAATQGPELTIVWAGNAKRSFAKVMA